MKVAVLIGHPRAGSFGAALGQAYASGARSAGCEVEVIDLSAIDFALDVITPSPRDQPWEPPLRDAATALFDADHWAIVWPAWWSVGPARLWGFLDRILLPGQSFIENEDGSYSGLLQGRTAHLICTVDMPPWVYRWIFRAPGVQAMRAGTLGLCGVDVTHTALAGPVKHASAAERDAWLSRARRSGLSLARGPYAAGRWPRLRAWLSALRLQFYPMTWMAYSTGALLGAHALRGGGWAALDAPTYALGYLMVFAAEAATVFINDLVDEPSDRLNRQYSTFTGGSRVLVTGRLRPGALRHGAVLALAAMLTLAGVLLGAWLPSRLGAAAALPASVVAVVLMMLAVGYTAPPVKLAWRGLGEIDVALTHSIGVILLGFTLQGGAWSAPLPWLVALPLGLAVLPAILLSGIPDHAADAAAGKRTLVVRLGPPRALRLAQALIIAALAALAAVVLAAPAARALLWPLLLVGSGLGGVLWRQLRALSRLRSMPQRIDSAMGTALTWLTVFALVPLLSASAAY